MTDRAEHPVAVGVGLLVQEVENAIDAREPIDLMIDAARSAAVDSGAYELLTRVGAVFVPKGRWGYSDPAGMIARAVGARAAKTYLSHVGVLQQHLIAQACSQIADGQIEAALVVGGDGGQRLQRAARQGVEVSERPSESVADVVWNPEEALRHAAELAAGMTMPVGLYAILESAIRAERGLSIEDHRNAIACLYASFSSVAAQNPLSLHRTAFRPDEIRNDGPGNRMQAFPYTARFCSDWSIDQASALLLTSERLADECSIMPAKRVYPLASAESNAMMCVSARPQLHRSPGARHASRALEDWVGIAPRDMEIIDLYSCFPSAVQLAAQELEIGSERSLTVTGGMAFAGGPYNNYTVMATGHLLRRLRSRPTGTGLVGSVSGIYTKQAFAAWSPRRPERNFLSIDVTAEVETEAPPLRVVSEYRGAGVVVGNTVLHRKGQPPRAIAVLGLPDDARCVAFTDDQSVAAAFATEEKVGNLMHVEGTKLLQA